MIQALIFDMDGTLVDTEPLKAQAYARAAQELHPDGGIREEDVVEVYKTLVGRSREETARGLVERFDLEDAARARRDAFGADAPWQAYTRLRLRYYRAMIADAETVRARRQPVSVKLLEETRTRRYKTALATTSDRFATDTILRALGLDSAFDTTATADDVQQEKPDPEISRLVARRLNVAPEDGLVIEDSTSGARAALAAGMHCIAAPTDYTEASFREAPWFDARRIAWDRAELPALVQQLIEQEGRR